MLKSDLSLVWEEKEISATLPQNIHKLLWDFWPKVRFLGRFFRATDLLWGLTLQIDHQTPRRLTKACNTLTHNCVLIGIILIKIALMQPSFLGPIVQYNKPVHSTIKRIKWHWSNTNSKLYRWVLLPENSNPSWPTNLGPKLPISGFPVFKLMSVIRMSQLSKYLARCW